MIPSPSLTQDLLLVHAHPQVADAVYGRLDVGLLERLDIDVTLYMLRSNHAP